MKAIHLHKFKGYLGQSMRMILSHSEQDFAYAVDQIVDLVTQDVAVHLYTMNNADTAQYPPGNPCLVQYQI